MSSPRNQLESRQEFDLKSQNPGTLRSTLRGRRVGRWWEVWLEGPCPSSEDCREAPEAQDAGLPLAHSSWAALQSSATSVTDGKQMFCFAGRNLSEIWSWGLRRPSFFVLPQKQIKEGKLHPSNDPARGFKYNRLKPIPCFKDLCNFERKKKKVIIL